MKLTNIDGMTSGMAPLDRERIYELEDLMRLRHPMGGEDSRPLLRSDCGDDW